MAGKEQEKQDLTPAFLRAQLDAMLSDRGWHIANIERLTAGLKKARMDAQKNEGGIELLQHMLRELDGGANVVQINPGGNAV
jgi:hypothetical protein